VADFAREITRGEIALALYGPAQHAPGREALREGLAA
jgi:hypothetical protein